MSVIACSPTATPVAPLPFFGEGYPAAGDPCRRLGENDFTRNWLDDARDLIACPEGPAANTMAAKPGAVDLGSQDGFRHSKHTLSLGASLV
jgi:hypothetical protein